MHELRQSIYSSLAVCPLWVIFGIYHQEKLVTKGQQMNLSNGSLGVVHSDLLTYIV